MDINNFCEKIIINFKQNNLSKVLLDLNELKQLDHNTYKQLKNKFKENMKKCRYSYVY